MTTEKLRYSRGGLPNQRSPKRWSDRLSRSLDVLVDLPVRDIVRRQLCPQTYGILGYRQTSRLGGVKLMVIAYCARDCLFWYDGSIETC